MPLIQPARPSHYDPRQELAVRLLAAKSPGDLAAIEEALSSTLLGFRAVLALPECIEGRWLHSVMLPSTLVTDHIIPYFSHQNLHCLNGGRLKRARLSVDYTISFDTNAATYVKRIVEEGSLKGLRDNVERTFDHVLSCGFNFDAFFYCVENIKQGHKAARQMKAEGYDSPQRFWESLNEGFRRNLNCIHRFMAVDSHHYQRTGTLRFSIGPDEAEREAVQFAYGFYASNDGQALISEMLVPLQRLILLQVIAMLRVQVSSESSPITKLGQFLDFVDDTGVLFHERETVIAFKYFKEPRSIPLFEKVNKGGPQKGLMNKVNNIAWDMTAPRFMERILAAKLQGDFTIPFFLSFDGPLCRAIREFPVKSAIIDTKTGGISSLPEVSTLGFFEAEGCGEIFRDFFSPDKKNRRNSLAEVSSEVALNRIRNEYRELYKLLEAT